MIKIKYCDKTLVQKPVKNTFAYFRNFNVSVIKWQYSHFILNVDHKECVGVSTFKKWPFQGNFNFKCEDGMVIEVMCKYCPNVMYDDFMKEVR